MKKAKPRLKIDSSSRPTTKSTQAHHFHKYATLGKVMKLGRCELLIETYFAVSLKTLVQSIHNVPM